jgi:hypothetical protein
MEETIDCRSGEFVGTVRRIKILFICEFEMRCANISNSRMGDGGGE